MDLKQYIRDIPDFPKPGVLFKDITPILKDSKAFLFVIDELTKDLEGRTVNAIAAVESRGFIFGAPLALRLGVPFVPLRKPGKLPAETLGVEYALEYGTNRIEIHKDALKKGEHVVVIDDLLATGGTAAAACELVNKLGAQVEKVLFVIELSFLSGREKLKGIDVSALLSFD
ncbi:MAG: adenine phosphoribosyltransferase [SAR324 cluster bacterium]|uniref:Adenine phosphoribosyltransferase n=1 Tax=SAR324 cluster bacterium TaxID=2024889 RepID=A0A7X9IJU5_9DELT|nr:adenine phosphoribosyltransferase [SAR324 cluster bacterium]